MGKKESEEMMIGSYGIGGGYMAHVDGKRRNPYDLRFATITNILEAPIAGGATVATYAGIYVFPEKGDGILWYNYFKNGKKDEYTTHMACPVLLGNKLIGNKWIGYNAQWKDIMCGLNHDSIFG